MTNATQNPRFSGQKAMTKREFAEVAIRNAIETGLYRPGQLISQRQIEEDLGLSVTPIREAILVLASNGIVERLSHQSIRVVELSPDWLKDIFKIREMLEIEAIRATATSCDDVLIKKLRRINGQLMVHLEEPETTEVNALDRQFHNAIFGACGNEALSWTIHRLKSSFPMYALWQEPGRMRTSTSEHEAIIDALNQNDPDSAAEAQREHLSNGYDATVNFLERLMSEQTLQ